MIAYHVVNLLSLDYLNLMFQRQSIYNYIKEYYKDHKGVSIKHRYDDFKYNSCINVCSFVPKVVKEDILDYVILNDIENPLILIFADDEIPGGCVLSGNGQQEESLFRRTALFKYLDKNLYPILLDECIYCKDVPVSFMSEERGSIQIDKKYCFIALPCIKNSKSNLNEFEIEVLRKKIELMFLTAKYYGHKNLVLGAWGLGVYGNDPKLIVSLFKEQCDKNKDIQVHFPILGHVINYFKNNL